MSKPSVKFLGPAFAREQNTAINDQSKILHPNENQLQDELKKLEEKIIAATETLSKFSGRIPECYTKVASKNIEDWKEQFKLLKNTNPKRGNVEEFLKAFPDNDELVIFHQQRIKTLGPDSIEKSDGKSPKGGSW